MTKRSGNMSDVPLAKRPRTPALGQKATVDARASTGTTNLASQAGPSGIRHTRPTGRVYQAVLHSKALTATTNQTSQAGPSGITRRPTTSVSNAPQAGTSGSNPPNSRHCSICDRDVPARSFSAHLRSLTHKAHVWTPVDDSLKVCRSAFGGKIVSYQVNSDVETMSVEEYLERVKVKSVQLLEQQVMKQTAIKVNLELFGLYILPTKDMRDIKSHNTMNKILTRSTDINQEFESFIGIISEKSKEFAERESGWVLEKILYLEINISKYNPLRASSYIPLPKDIASKKAIVNIQNNDEHCFAWSIVAALYTPKGRVCDTSSYPHYSAVPFLNFATTEFPVPLKAIPQWELSNQISINVYGLEPLLVDGQWKHHVVGPLHYTARKQAIHLNLLLIDDSEEKQHYCWIKNFSRLLSRQLSANHRVKHFCDGCLQYFDSESTLKRHVEENCKLIVVKLPTRETRIDRLGNTVPDDILKFENHHKQLKVPFCVYADFECILSPVPFDSSEPSSDSFTIKKYQHIPCSFAYYIKAAHDDAASKFYRYRGEDAAEKFINSLQTDMHQLYHKYLKDVTPMRMTPQDVDQYDAAGECYICGKPFTPLNRKVRDHCHITGKYRGAAHSICNLNHKIPKYIPIYMHNLRNYDSHLFITQLGVDKNDITVLPQTFEKYISFSKLLPVDQYTAQDGKVKNVVLQMRFVDSYQFLPAKLESLAALLEPSQCREVRKAFPEDAQFNHMRQKGVFPYSYLTNVEKFSEANLPAKECFYDELRDEHISDEEYSRACNVWATFGCQTLGDYSDIYLTADVLLLADVFENYRTLCLETYRLDPAHYFTAPGLSWDAMLRLTGVELTLLSDVDMIHFFKKGVRGGVSTCMSRKAEANNSYLPNYDPNKANSFIMYLDKTNLYGFSMCQHLPFGEFAWMTSDEIESFSHSFMEVSETSPVGYVVQVDLDVPTELHDYFNDYPFCPETLIPPGGKGSKLIPNLYNKRKYVIHYRALQQCVKHGLVLKQIHKGLRFAQAAWLKPYIDLNTQLRNQAKNKFENSLYKNMVNCIFGKSIENVENRVDIKLATTFETNDRKRGAANYISKPTFKELRIFSENLVAIQMAKTFIHYCRPTYVGFCILDIAKTVMYDFVYEFLKPTYGENCKILYTDTDSLIIHVKTPNFYDDMKTNITLFDTSNYTELNRHNIPKNPSVLGNMKDEYAGKVLSAFYGTGAKAYCIDAVDVIDKKAKGVSQASVKNQLDLVHYKSIVDGSREQVYCMMYVFKSVSHTIYTNYIKKVALTTHDDKRYRIPESTDTLAWGHKAIAFHETPPEERLDILLRLLDDAMVAQSSAHSV